jgi:zinc-binding alcohol dehydrogenase/oxidoreductase
LKAATMGSLSNFREVMELILNGTIKPVIDSVYPLEQAAEAYARYERGEQFGKIGLKIK